MDDTNAQEASGPGSGGGAGGGVAVIPDRPPLELDKLPPYHDVAPSPGTYPLKYPLHPLQGKIENDSYRLDSLLKRSRR